MSSAKTLRAMAVDPTPQLLTVEEVAALLRVQVSTIYVWTSKRKIPFRKVGGRLRFDRSDVMRWTLPQK